MVERDTNGRATPADARRREIVEMLLANESVMTSEIVDRFRVSAMTAHRDLDALQAQGLLRKVYGGATATPSGLFESSLAFRRRSMAEAKRQIGAHAARLVEPGSSVLLDDSTTTLALVPFLRDIPGLTIVTNFLAVLEEVARDGGDMRVILAGGEYEPKYHALMGVVTERALANLRIDLCFMSASAVDSGGVFHQDPAEVRLMRTRIEIAGQAVLLVDSTKLGRRALHHVVDLDAFSVIISESGADSAAVAGLRDAGGRVELAGDPAREPQAVRDTAGESRPARRKS